MAAPRVDDMWRLWDFGSIQFAENTLTGEFLKVYGPNALFGDGHFTMVIDKAMPGRPVLLGVDGTDDDRVIHLPHEHASYTMQWPCGEKPGDESIVSAGTKDGQTSWRLRDLNGGGGCKGADN